MPYNPDIHHRRSVRLKGYNYAQPGGYFITIVTQNKVCLFGNLENDRIVLNDAGQMIAAWYIELEKKFSNAKCNDYIIMPNHFHAIIEINEESATKITVNEKIDVGADRRVCPTVTTNKHQGNIQDEHIGSPLQQIIQWFKTMTTNEYIRRVKMNNWPSFSGKLWQRNYYEHIIRNEYDLTRIREYIQNNPLKWELDEENPDNLSP